MWLGVMVKTFSNCYGMGVYKAEWPPARSYHSGVPGALGCTGVLPRISCQFWALALKLICKEGARTHLKMWQREMPTQKQTEHEPSVF